MSVLADRFAVFSLAVSMMCSLSALGTPTRDEAWLNDRYANVTERCPEMHVFLAQEERDSGLYARYIKRIEADNTQGAVVSSTASGAMGPDTTVLLLVNPAKAPRKSDLSNDFKVRSWSKGCDPNLHIFACFYLSDEGKASAERDRQQYEQVCGRPVALEYMTFPDTRDGRISFTAMK